MSALSLTKNGKTSEINFLYIKVARIQRRKIILLINDICVEIQKNNDIFIIDRKFKTIMSQKKNEKPLSKNKQPSALYYIREPIECAHRYIYIHLDIYILALSSWPVFFLYISILL